MAAPDIHTRAKARTFGDILAGRAESTPDQLAFTFVHEGEDDEEVTYLEVHGRAQAVAAGLLDAVKPGSRALLLFAPGLDYVAAVFGCFQAGVVGVSASPPQPKRLNRTLPRLLAIAEDAQVDAVLTTAALREAAQPLFTDDQPLARARWIAVDDAAADSEPGVVPRGEADLAFMQYTSGSTSDPRGVMLSHGNLLSNSDVIARGFGHSRESRGFIWLPPYHDMGLIGGVLQPVYIGFPCALMSPIAVIKRPARWLEGVSRFRATTSGGPNFAYDLCVRRVGPEARESLDLSSWEVAFNGAEPIRAETVRSFTETFRPSGFRKSAFFTCYGLAEATLMVTGPAKEAEPTLLAFDSRELEAGRARPASADSRSATLVGCGGPDAEHHVAIVDPETLRRCPPGQIGEICVSGPSVAAGYWRREEETREVFGARIAGDDELRDFLRTGDLGMVEGGELFVVGRLKELIILNGRNYHPHDLEVSAESAHELLRGHCSAAFAIDAKATDGAAIILEVERAAKEEELPALIDGVRRQVAYDLDIQLQRIALCSPGSVPKTTSGKIQRQLCRKLLDDDELELLAESRVAG